MVHLGVKLFKIKPQSLFILSRVFKACCVSCCRACSTFGLGQNDFKVFAAFGPTQSKPTFPWWQAGLRPGGDHSRKTTTVEFYYYSKYDWSVISCTNTEPIDRNTTGLNWTRTTENRRIKSKQNLSVSLSPEVWQKCFVAAISWPTSFNFPSLGYCLRPRPAHPPSRPMAGQLCGAGSFLKADWSFSS